jgi:acyl dehydratase|tara:strand:- start:169 stop:654 length:486 start_codon:yes stop_codon:yes gene_type:complete
MESNIDKPYKTKFNSLIELKAYLGKELGVTKWYTMDQEKINIFADTTEDRQWIHIDRERSKKESPYKTTIAHGFLMLSMCSKIMFESFELKGVGMVINYGLDKVRFTNATLSGSKYRGRVSLMEFDSNPNGAKYKMKVIIELEGQDKPACIAELLALVYKA